MFTVLLADDDPDMRALCARTLRRAGMEVVPVAHGGILLEVFAAVSPDVVVLDVEMPVSGGLDTCRALRAMPAGATVPVLLMSSLAGPADIAAGRAAGADDYLPKPFRGADLVARVRRLVGDPPDDDGPAGEAPC